MKGTFLGYALRPGGGWSGDLMIADHEDLQESETSEIYVKRFEKPRNVHRKRTQISVLTRNSKTS